MWKVKKRKGHDHYILVNSDGVNYKYGRFNLLYRTPYQSEAQELADNLNGDSDG